MYIDRVFGIVLQSHRKTGWDLVKSQNRRAVEEDERKTRSHGRFTFSFVPSSQSLLVKALANHGELRTRSVFSLMRCPFTNLTILNRMSNPDWPHIFCRARPMPDIMDPLPLEKMISTEEILEPYHSLCMYVLYLPRSIYYS